MRKIPGMMTMAPRGSVRVLGAIGLAVLGLGAAGTASAQAATSQIVHPAASGGGCSGYTAAVDGISIKACVSANGDTAVFNGYVSGSTSKSCTLTQYLVDAVNNIAVSRSGAQNCTDGEHNGNTSTLFEVGDYYNQIVLTVNGQTVYADSPYLFD
jgi:hypothetical protein